MAVTLYSPTAEIFFRRRGRRRSEDARARARLPRPDHGLRARRSREPTAGGAVLIFGRQTDGICDLFERFPKVKAKVDAGYRGLAKQFPDQVQAPPPKPKKDARPEEVAAWDAARHQQSSERICVEHANAEHKKWRTLQRFGVDRSAAVNITSGGRTFTPLRSGATVPMSLLEFDQRVADHDGASFGSTPVRLTGFVARTADGNGFRIARYQIACCAADAVAAVVRVTGTAGNPPARDQWVTVTGTFQMRGTCSGVVLEAVGDDGPGSGGGLEFHDLP
jgi:hypothetical protein